jgi:hypothetical protein
MSTIICPFCGEPTNLSLKFCVSCGRAVTQADLQKAGLKIPKATDVVVRHDDGGHTAFKLSRKSYSIHRAIRHFFFTSSTVLMLVLVYYITMRFILHQHLPGNIDAKLSEFLSRYITFPK